MTRKLNRVFVLGSGFSSSLGLPTLAGLFKALMEFQERPVESYGTERAALDACVLDVAEETMGATIFPVNNGMGWGLSRSYCWGERPSITRRLNRAVNHAKR
jgi:hypothetical protein